MSPCAWQKTRRNIFSPARAGSPKLTPANAHPEMLEHFAHRVPDGPALAGRELLLKPPPDGLVAEFVLVKLDLVRRLGHEWAEILSTSPSMQVPGRG